MPYYEVTYSYLATGMEGKADNKNYGVWYAATPDEALEKVVLQEYPKDVMYGPNNIYSGRDFFRGFLSAREIINPEELE